METRIKYEFKSGVVVATGPEQARVLVGTYVGVPNAEAPDVYDLYRMDADGEPIGKCQGQMGSTIVEVGSNEEKH